MKHPAKDEQQQVEELVMKVGEIIHRVVDGEQTSIIVIPDPGRDQWICDTVRPLEFISHVEAIDTSYVLSARHSQKERTVVSITKDLHIGAREFVVMAGPCTVESKEQTYHIAQSVKKAGALVLRGGAFKPRTSPFTFQGLGQRGLEILAQTGQKLGLPIICEMTCQSQLPLFDKHADIIQVGMRNALNYPLLKTCGKLESKKPILLKGGIGATIDEFLAAADYILCEGNPNVILCLRGTIGFSQESRSAINVADIPALRRRTHLPIVVDPSHAAGRWGLVPAISAAALVAGADGLLVEVHHNPLTALVDGPQALLPERFERLMFRLAAIAPAVGRTLAPVEITRPDDAHPLHDLCLEDPGPAPGEKRPIIDDEERRALLSFLSTPPEPKKEQKNQRDK